MNATAFEPWTEERVRATCVKHRLLGHTYSVNFRTIGKCSVGYVFPKTLDCYIWKPGDGISHAVQMFELVRHLNANEAIYNPEDWA